MGSDKGADSAWRWQACDRREASVMLHIALSRALPLLLGLPILLGALSRRVPSSKPVPWFRRIRYALLGRPILSKHAHHERLGVFLGLPVFSSDALSSVAYATEAILSVLILGGAAAIGLTWPITIGICALIGIVAFSYRQTIDAYPSGGGSYVVASENLGRIPGLVAGAALLIDYVLTVAVSVAAGIAAITSAYPDLHPYLTQLSLFCVMLVAWANLRGVRESGAAFAVPTYGFVGLMLVMIVVGLFRTWGHTGAPALTGEPGAIGSELAVPMIFIFARAFAAGCTALTGIEAVSNGVPAFREPASRNASRTLVLMATLLLILFLGIGQIALHMPQLQLLATKNPEYKTLISQIASHIFGAGSFMFYAVQFMTAAILILAANTSFADFPRLSSLLARDGFLPRPLQRQGDRLVFQNGIILLAIAASVLIWHFHGELDLLLPLYAVGVFTAFTLSQIGMVMHWRKLRDRGWLAKGLVNGLGGIVTLLVAGVILATKFREGAWIVVILVAILMAVFSAIRRRYDNVAKQLALDEDYKPSYAAHTVLVLVPRLHRGAMKAIEYARHLGGEVRALHISIVPESSKGLVKQWADRVTDIPLVVLNSPYRSLTDPILEYVDQLALESPDRLITVIVAEAVPTKPWHRLLQESVALQLKVALGSRRNIVVSAVRYFLR